MNIKIMLWYDVEDYITVQADEALNSLIKMMDGRGVISSLKTVGDKARVLRDRGRFDILRKMAGHELCYHSDNHSRHPTMSEYLTNYGFRDGAVEFERRERVGFLDTMDIIGQFPTSYGQPGAAWAPQVFPVLRKWGIPTYVDSHYILNLNEMPFWYGGILNITRLYATMRMDLHGDEETALEAAEKEFDELCATEKDGENNTKFISIYYHPCEFSCHEFWDGVNFMKKNTPAHSWKESRTRSIDEMNALIERLGKFIDYTLTKDNVEYITAAQTLKYQYDGQEITTCCDIKKFASEFDGNVNYSKLNGRWYAPSEILSLMERYLSGRHLTAELYYGPEKRVETIANSKVKVSELVTAVREQYERVFGYKQLPDAYIIGDNVINPLSMFATLSAAINAGKSADDEIEIVKGGVLTPESLVRDDTAWGNDWLFPEVLDATNLVDMAKLQTWTIKPFDI
jgi:hypothetical protein